MKGFGKRSVALLRAFLAHIFQVTASTSSILNSSPALRISGSFLVNLATAFSWLSIKFRATALAAARSYNITASVVPPLASYQCWPETVENVFTFLRASTTPHKRSDVIPGQLRPLPFTVLLS